MCSNCPTRATSKQHPVKMQSRSKQPARQTALIIAALAVAMVMPVGVATGAYLYHQTKTHQLGERLDPTHASWVASLHLEENRQGIGEQVASQARPEIERLGITTDQAAKQISHSIDSALFPFNCNRKAKHLELGETRVMKCTAEDHFRRPPLHVSFRYRVDVTLRKEGPRMLPITRATGYEVKLTKVTKRYDKVPADNQPTPKQP